MSKEIGLLNKIKQADGQLVNQIDDETVLMSIENGEYYKMNAIAGLIWNKIEKPYVVEDLVKELSAEYQVDLKQCEEDVLELLNDLNENNLIVIEA